MIDTHPRAPRFRIKLERDIADKLECLRPKLRQVAAGYGVDGLKGKVELFAQEALRNHSAEILKNCAQWANSVGNGLARAAAKQGNNKIATAAKILSVGLQAGEAIAALVHVVKVYQKCRGQLEAKLDELIKGGHIITKICHFQWGIHGQMGFPNFEK